MLNEKRTTRRSIRIAVCYRANQASRKAGTCSEHRRAALDERHALRLVKLVMHALTHSPDLVIAMRACPYGPGLRAAQRPTHPSVDCVMR
jgi:hypothetical protein